MKETIDIEFDTRTGKPTPKGSIDLMCAIGECVLEILDEDMKTKPQDQAIQNNNIRLAMEWF